jgi:hypothetical protein
MTIGYWLWLFLVAMVIGHWLLAFCYRYQGYYGYGYLLLAMIIDYWLWLWLLFVAMTIFYGHSLLATR